MGVGAAGLLLLATGHAQDRKDALEALERERTQQIREAQVRSTPQWAGAAQAAWLPPTPDEAPCFVIERVEITGLPTRLEGLADHLGDFQGACLGPKSIESLRRNLDARLVARGLVTSSLSLPAQNLSTGLLRYDLHLGRLARIERRGPAAQAVARNALALRAGDVLNLRDIEQTLDNLSRLPSQAAQVQIEAADTADESVVVLAAAERRRWRISVGADNSGAQDFGRWQGSVNLVLDAPLGLSDQLSAYVAGPPGRGERFQRTGIVSYSVPWGYHLFSLSASRSEHARPIQGLSTTFSENGHDSSLQARWQWTAWRSASSRWAVWLGATQRRTHNFIDDVELLLQRRNVRSNDWGFNGWWRRDAGEFQLDYEQALGIRQPLDTDFAVDPPPLVHTARAQLGWQHDLGAWRHELRLTWAGVRDPASGADYQALGSRWTVRGFDARGLLSGTEQFTLKQDVRGPGIEWRDGWVLQPYGALDLGRVAGGPPNGRTLAGAAAGLRFQASGLSGDLAVAAPLHKPNGFEAASAVFYASFNFTY